MPLWRRDRGRRHLPDQPSGEITIERNLENRRPEGEPEPAPTSTEPSGGTAEGFSPSPLLDESVPSAPQPEPEPEAAGSGTDGASEAEPTEPPVEPSIKSTAPASTASESLAPADDRVVATVAEELVEQEVVAADPKESAVESAGEAPPDTEVTEPAEDASTPEPVGAPAPRTPQRPAHARVDATTTFAERAQMSMERLGELPGGTNGARAPRTLPRVVAIANQKGGVGKTTTTVNLGAALSELDYRVLVVDLDPQGNATSGLGIDTRNFESSMYDVIMRDAPIEDCIEPTNVQNLFVTPATIDLAGVEIELVSAFSRELKLKRAIDTVVDDFDFVLIDCPPSLGLLTVNGLAAATEVMVPIQCEYYALEGLSQLIRNVQLVAANLNAGLEISAIVLTMFDARTRLAIEVADEVRTHFKEVVCRSIIPRTVRLSEAPSFGQPITVFDPSSRGAVAYRELAKEVSDGAPKRSG
jgi:chromosome partitioning protein